MHEQMKFVLPLELYLPRKTKVDKRVLLNKNIERNLHYQEKNQLKQMFTDLLTKQCIGKKIDVFPQICYIHVYPGKKTSRFDVDNFSILAKFGLDALTTHGVIPDDNYKYISTVVIRYIKHDINPRAEMFLVEEYNHSHLRGGKGYPYLPEDN